MLAQILLTASLAFHYLAVFPVTAIPLEDRALLLPDLRSLSEHLSAPTNLRRPSLNTSSNYDDREKFIYAIPRTTQTLQGWVFTRNPIRPQSLHAVLQAGLDYAQQRLSHRGPNARLLLHENPYAIDVPGCYAEVKSRRATDGQPGMTWLMIRNLFLALQQVLERDRRFFDAAFVLMDENKVSWGHGQVLRVMAES
ncbi:MAG: hypothetical protein Q9211_004914 [Gyalolechia sp. 1 TL-2023]